MSAHKTKTRAARDTQDGLVVAASYRLYRLLLLICPPRFRRRYGAEMAQVFRDCCRVTWRDGDARSALALLALWGRSLLDLVVTAISVWRKESIVMSARSGMRVAALAGLVAGAWCSSIVVGLALVVVSGNLSSGLAWLWPVLHGVGSGLMTLEVATPALWALFMLGLVGLYLYLDRSRASKRGRWLLWSACALTCLGPLLLHVGGPVTMWRWFPVAWFANLYYPVDLYQAQARIAGAIVMAVGLSITCLLALRIKALGSLRWLLLGLSLLAIVSASYALAVFWISPGPALAYSPGGRLRYGWYLLMLVWDVLWGVIWIPLGMRLWALAGASPANRPVPSLMS